MIKACAVLLTLAGVVTASEAQAQSYYRRSPVVPTTPGSVTYSSSYSTPAPIAQPARIYTYSYYTLSPLPPRTYVSFGTEDFAFHGVPYGHPYDPWTWSMMSGSYGKGLARYFDPPVK